MNRLLAIALVVASLMGCRGREPAEAPPAGAETVVAAEPSADSVARVRAAAAATAEVRTMIGRQIHFNFDRTGIRAGEDTQVLEQKLAILRANPNLRIEITGHCDARGTRQYNTALGMRRAESAKRFFTSRGLSGDRIAVRSRGEDEPLDPGRTRQAWARNRRAEFAITAGGDQLVKPAEP